MLCEGVTETCVEPELSAIHLLLNCVSIVSNIVHLVVLSGIEKSKKTKHYWSIINIGITDIGVSVSQILAVSCEITTHVLSLTNQQAQQYQTVALILIGGSSTARLAVLALSSYERYVSICRPLQATSNKVLDNFVVSIIVIWTISYGTVTLTILTKSDTYCYGQFGALPGQVDTATLITYSVIILATFLTCSVCLYKVRVELKRMAERNIPGHDDDSIKRSATYIMLICALFYFSYIPTLISTPGYSVKALKGVTQALTWGVMIYNACYGTLNIVIYICMTPGYRVHIRKLFKCRGNLSQVAPAAPA